MLLSCIDIFFAYFVEPIACYYYYYCTALELYFVLQRFFFFADTFFILYRVLHSLINDQNDIDTMNINVEGERDGKNFKIAVLEFTDNHGNIVISGDDKRNGVLALDKNWN